MQVLQYPLVPGDQTIDLPYADGTPVDAVWDGIGLALQVRRDPNFQGGPGFRRLTVRVLLNQEVGLGDETVPPFLRSVAVPSNGGIVTIPPPPGTPQPGDVCHVYIVSSVIV